MKNNDYIKNLLKKINKEELSASELQTLNELLGKNNQDADQLFSSEWDKSAEFSDEYKSDYQLKILQNKLGFTNASSENIQHSRKIKKLIYQSLKYAAILFLGITISWFVYSHNNKNLLTEATRQCTITVAYGSKTTIQLPDGSMVHLNSGSTLSYPANFEKSYRTVTLKGEGFFDVTKDASRPFYVKTDKITVKVLGTSFNVKSYPDENKTETTLVTGKIEIYKNENNIQPYQLTNRIAVLNPQQKAVILNNNLVPEEKNTAIRSNPELIPIHNALQVEDKIKTELFTDWRKNLLVFNNEKFADIAKILERWYNVEISLKYESLNEIRFSGKFDLESVSEVLNALSLIENFKYDIKKNKITIY